MYETSAIKKTGCYSILSFVFLFYLCTVFVHFTEAAVINSGQHHIPQSVLTTQLSHNQAMPSLMLQQINTLLTTDTTRPYSELTCTHTMYFKFHNSFTLKSLPQSPKQYCPIMFVAHNIMLFSFPHTLYVHQYVAP